MLLCVHKNHDFGVILTLNHASARSQEKTHLICRMGGLGVGGMFAQNGRDILYLGFYFVLSGQFVVALDDLFYKTSD